MDQKSRIDYLVSVLNEASNAYYGGREEQMSNFEWDQMFDELKALEIETNYVRSDSPTQNIGHDSEDADGEKEVHEYPALSLAKTKNVEELEKWAGERLIWLSWKLDGLTLVLTYDNGRLSKIVTRGNGSAGNNITYMKEAICCIPLTIKDQGHVVVRGEAVISYTDFERINDTMGDDDEKYANPRNLASGTLALDRKNVDKVKDRAVTFHAFTLVYTQENITSWGERMAYLDQLGFLTVERERTDAAGISAVVEKWTAKVDHGEIDLPVDGLVITYDDTEYAATGSITGHHATRAGFAYKWEDVKAATRLERIDWSCAASTITPVAVLSPVRLEGTTVTRASLCNISELERLGIGENGKTEVEVIKANKIIPKCVSVLKAEGTFEIPKKCPVCQAPTEIRVSANSGVKTLRCTNADCPAKHLKRFSRFVSKMGMDIDGLSIQTLRVFVNQGFIRDYADIYHLSQYENEIVNLDGFGTKSYINLVEAIEKSRSVSLINFIYALCIPMIGIDAAKKILAALGSEGFMKRIEEQLPFDDIDGIGPEKSGAILAWFSVPNNMKLYQKLLEEVTIQQILPKEENNGSCRGMVFVITGEVHLFKNRTEFKQYVENQGGTVTGSVSKKTTYLINNDRDSTSSKNKKARELGIPILSEDEFVVRFGK